VRGEKKERRPRKGGEEGITTSNQLTNKIVVALQVLGDGVHNQYDEVTFVVQEQA
jgi:hypothetical protein